jgi:hypothetical protein
MADPPNGSLRPIDKAESVMAVYYRDMGLASNGHPELILAAWPDGRLIWSENRLKGGVPYRTAQVDPEKFTKMMKKFEKQGLLADKKLNGAYWAPDSECVTILVKSGDKKVEMQSWHETVEEAGMFADGGAGRGVARNERLRNGSPDYLFFRFIWSETRGGITDLIPAEGQRTTGVTHMKAGVLSWQEAVDPMKE